MLDSVYNSIVGFQPYNYNDWRHVIHNKVQYINDNPSGYSNPDVILGQLSILENSIELWAEQYAEDNNTTVQAARGGSSAAISLPNWGCVIDAAYEDAFGYGHNDICGDVPVFEDQVACTTGYSLTCVRSLHVY